MTELLSHFYAIVHRTIADSNTKQKLEKILKRLINTYNDPLELKKQNIIAGSYLSTLSKPQKGKQCEIKHVLSYRSLVPDNLISIINGYLMLIEKAKIAWKEFLNPNLC